MGLTFDDCIDLYLSEKGKDVFFKVSDNVCPHYEFLLRAKEPCLSSIDFVSVGHKNSYLYIECDILAIYPSPLIKIDKKDTFTIYPHSMNIYIEQVTLSELPLFIGGYLTDVGKEQLMKGV